MDFKNKDEPKMDNASKNKNGPKNENACFPWQFLFSYQYAAFLYIDFLGFSNRKIIIMKHNISFKCAGVYCDLLG